MALNPGAWVPVPGSTPVDPIVLLGVVVVVLSFFVIFLIPHATYDRDVLVTDQGLDLPYVQSFKYFGGVVRLDFQSITSAKVWRRFPQSMPYLELNLRDGRRLYFDMTRLQDYVDDQGMELTRYLIARLNAGE